MIQRPLIGWKPTSTSDRVASVRIRCLNLVSKLASEGYPVEVFRSENLANYRAVVYSKIYDEATYAEALSLKERGCKIVFDLCDNHFYVQNSTVKLEQRVERLKKMMQLADNLVASTPELAAVMRRETESATGVSIIGDAVETTMPKVSGSISSFWQRRRAASVIAKLKRRQTGTRLIWFGNHGVDNADAGMADLLMLKPLVERLNADFPLSLTVCSNSWTKYRRWISNWEIHTYYVPWRPNTVLSVMQAHDIAVIPVTRNPFTWCKSNNRLAFAISRGLAVVADPVPSYMEFGEFTFLDDWENGLVTYINDPNLRRRHVEGARAIIDARYTLDSIAAAWRRLLGEVLARSSTNQVLGAKATTM